MSGQEPSRRVIGVTSFAHAESTLTFTQVGWMLWPANEFIPLGGDIPAGVVFAPVWVEGPNE